MLAPDPHSLGGSLFENRPKNGGRVGLPAKQPQNRSSRASKNRQTTAPAAVGPARLHGFAGAAFAVVAKVHDALIRHSIFSFPHWWLGGLVVWCPIPQLQEPEVQIQKKDANRQLRPASMFPRIGGLDWWFGGLRVWLVHCFVL